MNTGKVIKFKATDVPRQPGEVGRLRVLKGPDLGTTYILKDSSITIGRGDEVDLTLTDIKTSRTHAKLEYTSGGWVMSDLGSANGIFFQGEYIRKFGLASHEHFTLGDSILEFLTHSESTRALMAPVRPAAAVVQQDRALANQRLRVQAISKSPEIAKKAKPKENPAKIAVYIAILGGLYFFMNDEPQRAAPKPAAKKEDKENRSNRNLASYLPPGVGREAAKSAEQSYWEGFREYREGHYLRAKEHFELALQVNPGHELARFYLKSAEKEIDDEINRMISGAQKSIVAGRLREAKGYYEAAMRAMFNDRNNPDYAECEEAVKKINEEIGRAPAGEDDK